MSAKTRTVSKGSRTKQNQNKKGQTNMKKVAIQPIETATDKVVALMKKHPEMGGADIARETGIKKGTVYAVMSRKRKEAEAKANVKVENKKPAGRISMNNNAVKEHDAIVDSPAMKDMKDVVNEAPNEMNASRSDLFDYVTSTYLNKIAENAHDVEVAKMYHSFLMDMMKEF